MPRLTHIVAFLALPLLAGCDLFGPAPREPITNLDAAAARLEQLAGTPLRPYATFDGGRQMDPSARSVIVSGNTADSLVEQLRDEVGAGLVVYVGTSQWLGDERPHGVEVVVALGETQFDILRSARSDAPSVDLDTDQLVARLQALDERYGIEIVHAETGAVEFKLNELPADLDELCRDISELCPAKADPTVDGMESLEEVISKQHGVLLRWE